MTSMIILAGYLAVGGYFGVKAFNNSKPEEQGDVCWQIGITIGILTWPLATLAVGLVMWYTNRKK